MSGNRDLKRVRVDAPKSTRMRQYIDICTSERCGNADFTLITGNISYRVQKSRIEDMFSTTSGDLKFKRSFTLPEEDVVRVNAAAFEMYLRALHHEDREMKLPPHTMLSFQLLQGIAKVCVRYGGEALIPESFKSALVMPRGFIDDFDVDFLPSLLVACELGWWNESKVLFREVLKHVSFNDEEYWVYRNDILLDNPDLPWSLCRALLIARELVLQAHILTNITHFSNLWDYSVAQRGACHLHANADCSTRLLTDFVVTSMESGMATDYLFANHMWWNEAERVSVSLAAILRVYRRRAEKNERNLNPEECTHAGWHERNLMQLIKGCAVPMDILNRGRKD